MTEKLALFGSEPVVAAPQPRFRRPPPIPGLPGVIARYIEEGGPLSIVDRRGIYGALEDRLCEMHGREHAILCSSGTMALYSAFFGLDL